MITVVSQPPENIAVSPRNVALLLAGAASLLLGALVLTGWYTHNTALLQVIPGFVAMQYNTALGFFLTGAGLLCVGFGKPRFGPLFGGVVAATGIVTLAEYIFSINGGIDQLLMQAYTVGQTAVTSPGRMALNTAICFSLAGLALIVMAVQPVKLRQHSLILAVLGALILALAVVPFAGYLTGVASSYGWGSLTRMAVHTAVGMMVIGTGIVAYAWQEDRAGAGGAPRWLPVLVGIGTGLVTLLLWQALVAEQRTNTQRLVATQTTLIRGQIADRMKSRIEILARLAARWDIYGKPTQETWESDARLLLGAGSIDKAVEWADPSLHVRWIAARDGSRADQGSDLSANPKTRAALQTALDRHAPSVAAGKERMPDGKPEVTVFVPTFEGAQFSGFVIGVFEAKVLLESIMGNETARGYSIAVQSGGDDVYTNQASTREFYAELHNETTVDLPGTSWHVQVWPTTRLIAESESPFPLVVLISGLAMALLLAATAYLAQTARSHSRDVDMTNLVLAREIAERKRVKADKDRLFATSSDLMGIANVDGYWTEVNVAFEKTLGFSSSELAARPLLEFIHPDDRASTLAEIGKLSEGATTLNFLNRYLCKDGSYTWIDWNAVPVVEEGLIYAVGRDMTERKEAERAVRESEAKLRAVTQSAHDAIIAADTEGSVISWNKGASAIFGYEEAEILGKPLTVLMPERYRDAHTAGMYRVTTTGDTHVIGKTVQMDGLRKDGNEFPLELSLSTWETEAGTFYSGIARDITERKQAEEEIRELNKNLEHRVDLRTAELQATNRKLEIEFMERRQAEAALREGEERFRLLVAGVKDYAILMLDPAGNVTSWNEGAKRIKGYEAEEIIGKHFSTFYPVEDVEAGKPEHDLGVAAAEGRFEDEGWRVRKDGSRFWTNMVIAAMRDENGRLRGFSKVSRDITERKMAAERTAFLVEASSTLASSLDYQETLMMVARIAVPQIADWCTVDIVEEDGQVRRLATAHADPAKEEMAQEYMRRFPPKPDSDNGVSLVLRTMRPSLMPKFDRAMLESLVTDPEQLEYVRKFWPTSVMIVPLIAHGRPVGAISLLTAESRREYGPDDLLFAEEVARRAATAIENSRLYTLAEKARDEAESLGDELKNSVAELERSNIELQQFAYVASHDLQEPLRMVASYTQLLSRRYKGKLDESADEFIAYAVDGANRMQKLINDLLAYSRVTTQGGAFQRTNCEAILKQALDNLSVTLRESGATVTHDPLPEVLGDDSQLIQLFQNLIGNAVKFHGDEPPTVHIGVEAAESEWHFCVRDNGIGMDPKYADRIFVIFQRLHSKEEYPGTGIGLSVCKKVVERHGGRIWVESQPGMGTTFYFTIPNEKGLSQAAAQRYVSGISVDRRLQETKVASDI